MVKQKYPEYFPIGCPPMDADLSEQTLYRLCYEHQPSEKDFVSYYLQNPKKFVDQINAYGLSVMLSREDCFEMYRKYPWVRRYHSIAWGVTNYERGSWKRTPSRYNPTHVTWWVCDGVRPETFFIFDKELEENEHG